MGKVKMILLDLDGTLLTSQKQISARNYASLERFASAGGYVVPCTGRFYRGMPQVVRKLPFVRYVVTVNGAQVYDAVQDEILRREEISPTEAVEIFDRLELLPVIYDCFLDGWGYMDQAHYGQIDQFISDPQVNRMVKELREPVKDLRGLVKQENRPLQKIQMFFRDMERRKLELSRLSDSLPRMAVTSSIANNIEINAQNANKGAALCFLCRHLDINVEDTMAFGDGSNDRSMIEAAGIGVAMGNAENSLKTLADYVTDHHDNDGVAKAVEQFC